VRFAGTCAVRAVRRKTDDFDKHLETENAEWLKDGGLILLSIVPLIFINIYQYYHSKLLLCDIILRDNEILNIKYC